MEAPGRRCLRGGGAGSRRRAGGAAVSPQRWLRWYIVHRSRKHEAHRGWQSASSTSIFKHRTHAHTQRHKNWEGRGGRGRGGGATQTILLQNNNSSAVPPRGDGAAPAGSPRLRSPLHRGGWRGHPTHNHHPQQHRRRHHESGCLQRLEMQNLDRK